MSAMGDRKATFSMNSPQPVPGGYGLPVLGKIAGLIDFFLVSGWEQFFRRRERKYGSKIFKVNLFQPTIAVLDHRAIVPLFGSDDLVQDYGFSWAVPPLPLVGNVPPSVFGAGPAHDRPKSLYLRLVQERSSTLVGTFDAIADEFIKRWTSLGRFGFRDELEDFAACFLFEWMLRARPDPKDVREVYNGIFTHFAVSITKHFRSSAYSRSVITYQRLLAFVKSAPGFGDILRLAREEGLTDEDAIAKQITFLLGMNSFLGTQSLLKSIVGELSLRPDLCATLRQESAAVLGAGAVDLRKLAAMPMLDRTLREILRLHPPVSFIFGRATRDRSLESSSGTFAIGKGDLVMGVIPFAHRDGSVFTRPEDFDPDRFNNPDASAHLIWPRGLHDAAVSPHDRTCPGKDVAILIAKLFCIALLKNDWRLKDPRPEWDRHRFSLNVAAPKGALDIESFHPRVDAAPATRAH
jgi:prostaglandin-endoperoxide synthase 2